MSADAAADRRTDTIPEWKRREVDEIVDFIERYESIGIVGFTGIPSRQLQIMRRELHGDAALRISRNTLLRRALSDVDEGVEELLEYVEGQVGIIATDENPFGLYRQLEASKSPAPINEGETAPNDVVIPAGDTGIDPGPFVGELQTVGAAARIQDGSIHVTEDSTVLEAGDTVSAELANVLGELGIEPKEVGLDLRAVYSDGVLFEPEELEIDVDEYRADVQSAIGTARSLSIGAAIPTAATMAPLIAKATGEAKSLGLQASIESPSLAGDLISRADAQVRTLAAQIDDEEALPADLRGIEAPSAPPVAADSADDSDEKADAEADAEADADPDADGDDDDDDDDDAGAAGLGEMFG